MINHRMLDTMQQYGDRFTDRRAVEHRAYFSTKPLVKGAIAALQQARFVVSEPVRCDTGQDSPVWLLAFHRDETISPIDVERFCTEVLDIVLAFEGEYDGWGAQCIETA